MQIISAGYNENNRWKKRCDTKCAVMRWSNSECN